MKQLRILTRVYDRENGTYIQRCLTYDLNERQVELFQRFMQSIHETQGSWFPKVHGFGEWDKEEKAEVGVNGATQYDPEWDDPDVRDESHPLYHRIKTPCGTENRMDIRTDFCLADEKTQKTTFGFTDC